VPVQRADLLDLLGIPLRFVVGCLSVRLVVNVRFQVALVRMCADGAKSPAQRFGYAHAFDALLRIGRDEGVRTFARGLGPNVVRSVIMNVSQIGT
jgi:dicarboxylate transporter 10